MQTKDVALLTVCECECSTDAKEKRNELLSRVLARLRMLTCMDSAFLWVAVRAHTMHCSWFACCCCPLATIHPVACQDPMQRRVVTVTVVGEQAHRRHRVRIPSGPPSPLWVTTSAGLTENKVSATSSPKFCMESRHYCYCLFTAS